MRPVNRSEFSSDLDEGAGWRGPHPTVSGGVAGWPIGTMKCWQGRSAENCDACEVSGGVSLLALGEQRFPTSRCGDLLLVRPDRPLFPLRVSFGDGVHIICCLQADKIHRGLPDASLAAPLETKGWGVLDI